MMKQLIIIVLTVLSSNVFSQDLISDIKKMYEYIELNPELLLEIEVSGKNNNVEMFGEKLSLHTSENGLYYNYGFAEIAISKEKTIIVNHTEKSIVYAENTEGKINEKNWLEQQFGTLEEFAKQFQSVQYNEQNKEYQITFSENEMYTQIDIAFDNNGFLKFINYHYSKNEFSEIENLYTGIKATKIPLNQEKINPDAYLTLTNKMVSGPSNNYSDYSITYNESINNYLK